MWLDQTKFNISGQRVNETSAERLQSRRKHFLQSVMVSVAVSKLAETDHLFVQSDANINSVYYCENVLEQGLLPAICCISNNNFMDHYAERLHTVRTTLSLRPTCVPVCLGSLNQKTGRRTVQI